MKKLLIGIILLPLFASAQYNLTQDTTISTTWTLGIQIVSIAPGVKVHGTGTISGGYIQASYYQDIFDTTLTVNIKGGAQGIISSSWFGTSPSKTNNTRYFQKAIDASINKSMTLYTPAGVYIDSSYILIGATYAGDWTSVSLKWKGDYIFNGAVPGTVIDYKNIGNFALGIQKAKGVIIEGISIQGRFATLNKANPETNYWDIPFDDFRDTTVSEYHSGVIVDPYPNVSGLAGGSTGVLFRDMYVTGFTNLFRIGNVSALNAEEIIAERIVFGKGRTGWVSTQAQEKQNVIRNSMAWSTLHTFFTANSGNGTGNYHIHDINIAGSVVQIFNIQQGGWFSTKIDNIYAERIGSIGTLNTTAMVISVRDCLFQFAYKSEAGNQYLAKTNSLKVRFTGCDFNYFGETYSMAFQGLATFDGCYFSGAYTNSVQGSVFTTSCQFIQ